MTPRVICDTMIFYQWATLRRERLHGTHTAVLEGRIQLCVSLELLTEVRDLLSRPAIRAKSPHLSDERITRFLDGVLAKAELIREPPRVFTLAHHPDDDHLFNLAIAARADCIVTWETRLLDLENPDSPDGQRLRALNPRVRIVAPHALMNALRAPS